MVFGLFRKGKNNRKIVDRQYDRLTQTARLPAFYLVMAVPDTVMGRFEMLSLVMILYLRRTARSDTSGQEIAQFIIDAFFQDIDHSIRELGIGDQAVPKRMKKLAGMFYGRLEAYGKAIEAEDEIGLEAALKRNFYPEQADAPAMAALARWTLEAETALAGLDEEAVVTGSVHYPMPGEQVYQ